METYPQTDFYTWQTQKFKKKVVLSTVKDCWLELKVFENITIWESTERGQSRRKSIHLVTDQLCAHAHAV